MTNEDAIQVKVQLEKYIYQLTNVIELASADSPNKAEVKNAYGVIKTNLMYERDKSHKLKTEKEATKAELAFYYPADCEAASALSVAIGGKINEEFIATLYDAQGQIEYYLSSLQSA